LEDEPVLETEKKGKTLKKRGRGGSSFEGTTECLDLLGDRRV